MDSDRPQEIISQRPTADFNRLVFSRISHRLQSDSPPQDYVDYDDEPEKLTNSLRPDGGIESDSNGPSDATKTNFDDGAVDGPTGDTQGRHFIKVQHKKKKKKKPCIPYSNKYGRTYPNLNVVFVDVNYNGEYNTNGGYNCHPVYGNGGALGDLFGSHNNDDANEQNDVTNSGNSHGGLLSNLGVGTVANRPQNGGPLGFFGQGGLFDFSGGSGGSTGVRPQVDDPYSYNDVKPVIEINVPDTVQDAVSVWWIG